MAYLILFLGGAAALGPQVDPTALTPAEQAQSGQAALIVAAIDLAILGTWVARARWRGAKLWLLAAMVLYGVKTFSSQLEVAFFVQATHVPPAMLPRLFAMTLPLCVVWPALLVWALGPADTAPPAPDRSEMALLGRIVLAGMVVYPVLFFTFGYYVAWLQPAVRAYYGGPEVPLPFLAHLAHEFTTRPAVVPFEMARGLLWVLLGWPMLRGTRGPWWVGTVLYALTMALVQNDLHLLPNPLMPPAVRHWHLLETATSNFLFAGVTGLLVRPRGAIP